MLLELSILLALFDGPVGIGKIAKENTLKKEAQSAYAEGRYSDAISALKTLTDEYNIADDKVNVDLGHAYFKANDLSNAAKQYQKSLAATDKNLRSVAAQQLGTISLKADNDKEKALAFFKEALRANPANAEARHNYELLMKQKNDPNQNNQPNQNNKNDNKENKDNKDQNQQNKNDQNGQKDKQNQKGGDNKQNQDNKQQGDKGDKNQDNKDSKEGDKKEDKNSDNKNGSDKEGGDKDKEKAEKGKNDKSGKDGKSPDGQKDGKEDETGNAKKEKQGGKQEKDKVVVNPEALAQMGMTEQKAKALLNAMRSSETQYIQQMKREPAKKQKKGKPDW